MPIIRTDCDRILGASSLLVARVFGLGAENNLPTSEVNRCCNVRL